MFFSRLRRLAEACRPLVTVLSILSFCAPAVSFATGSDAVVAWARARGASAN